MSLAIDIGTLTTEEKLRLLEAVWQDLGRDPESVPAPGWHRAVLEEREQNLLEGTSRLDDWSEAKRRIREQIG